MRKIFSETPSSKLPSLVQIGEHQTKGERSTMEDTSLIHHDGDCTDFIVAIFDGHNGSRCSRFLRDSLLDEFSKQMKLHHHTSLDQALKSTYLTIDQKWLSYAHENDCNDGSTGLCVMVNNNRILVANTGDCRAIMNRAGKCVELTRDHRPTDPEEMKRIEDNGGKVIGGRLQGELAVSRAFGDYRYKILDNSVLICEPEIREYPLTSETEYLVLACDGLYETFTNSEVIDFINQQIIASSSPDLNQIAQNLAEEAIDRGSGDNISIIIIKFEKKSNHSRKRLNTVYHRAAAKKTKKNEKLNNNNHLQPNEEVSGIARRRKSSEGATMLLKAVEKESISDKKRRMLSDDDLSESLISESDEDAPPSLIQSGEYVSEPIITISLPKEDFPDQAHEKPKRFGLKYKNPLNCNNINKKLKSKDYLSNFKLKKCKSGDDITHQSDEKKLFKVLNSRRRSKSSEDPSLNIRNLEKRLLKKKGDSSSDEFEKELLKKKKQKRNSLSLKSVSINNDPLGNLRSTMDESILDKYLSKTSSSGTTSGNTSGTTSGNTSGTTSGNTSRTTSTKNLKPPEYHITRKSSSKQPLILSEQLLSAPPKNSKLSPRGGAENTPILLGCPIKTKSVDPNSCNNNNNHNRIPKGILVDSNHHPVKGKSRAESLGIRSSKLSSDISGILPRTELHQSPNPKTFVFKKH